MPESAREYSARKKAEDKQYKAEQAKLRRQAHSEISITLSKHLSLIRAWGSTGSRSSVGSNIWVVWLFAGVFAAWAFFFGGAPGLGILALLGAAALTVLGYLLFGRWYRKQWKDYVSHNRFWLDSKGRQFRDNTHGTPPPLTQEQALNNIASDMRDIRRGEFWRE